MLSKIDLTIIIVNWNVKDLLRNCLKSIHESTSRVSFEIFVVDNASADGSVEMVKEEFPQVKLIANEENLGFPKANNQATKISNGEYILFLNPDTVVYPKSVEMMVNFVKANKNCGAVGPMIMDKEGKIDFTCARNFPTVATMLFRVLHLNRLFPRSKLFGKYSISYWDHKDSRSIPCLTGACMLVRRKTLEEVGFFEDQLPMFFEDRDLCRKIKEKGWDVHYLSSAKIRHFQGSCTKRFAHNELVERMLWEALDMFFKKYHGNLYSLIFHVVLFCGSIFNLTGIGIGSLLLLLRREKNNSAAFFVKYLEMFKFSLGLGEKDYYKELLLSNDKK